MSFLQLFFGCKPSVSVASLKRMALSFTTLSARVWTWKRVPSSLGNQITMSVALAIVGSMTRLSIMDSFHRSIFPSFAISRKRKLPRNSGTSGLQRLIVINEDNPISFQESVMCMSLRNKWNFVESRESPFLLSSLSRERKRVGKSHEFE